MDRHVIKGRGKNRGKYLCWGRQSPLGKATEDGFVWLPKQCKAVRWADPRYSGRTWATDRARLHNGYFVKLVAPPAIVERVVGLRAYIAEHATGSTEGEPCYWFSGDFHDAGDNFCRGCAEKLVDEEYAKDPKLFKKLYGADCEDAEDRYQAAIDGGFDTSHDSPPDCATCGAKLSGNLTDHGADEENEALTGDCAPDFDEVEGWAALDNALVNVSDDDPRWRSIAKIVDAAKAAEQLAAKAG